MTLDDRQLATVLYALRQYEARVSDESERRRLAHAEIHFAEHEPLTADETDALCEQLNVGVTQ